MLKKLFCGFFALIFLCRPFSIKALASAPSVSAESAVLFCANDDSFIFEKNADSRMPMASTTKIMTCITALESCELNDIVCICSDSVGVEGSSLYLNAGDRLTLCDLLYAVMLRSANDAASAVAYHVAGSIEAFADMMNEKAASLGLDNTHFTNPHGLHDETHYTTARDFAILTSYALKNADFRKIVSTTDYTVVLNEGSCKKPIVNHNKLLRIYEGANGVKTGFTKSSGRCLVSSAERDGVLLVAVTLNAPSDWNDHISMLDYGFSQYTRTTVYETGQLSRTFQIVGCESVEAANAEPFSAVIRKGSEISVKIEAKQLMFAPVSKGETIATATVYADGKELGKINLNAKEDRILPDEPTFTDKLKKILNFTE